MIRIAIDGPGGAGKSTIAKLVGNRERISPNDIEAIRESLDNTSIDFVDGKIILDDEDVSDIIRTQEISKLASMYSQIPDVRTKLVDIQRRIAGGKGVIMDGRDIGTNVLTDAELKIFLTAAPMIRARRRYDELVSKGVQAVFNDIYDDIKDRDYQDSHRKLNPLVKAEDAVLLDTSEMSIEEVVDAISAEADRVSAK